MKRYTIKELKEFSDYRFIYWLIRDRQESTTNIYSPLNDRLANLQNKIEKELPLTKDSD
jgi:hypothetical protein